MSRLLNLIIIGVTTGSLYALVTVGFGLIFNATHIFHLAHAAVVCISAYVAYSLSVEHHVPLLLGFSIGLVASVVIGIACETFVYGPLRARGSDPRSMFLMSVGLLTVAEGVLGAIYGPTALSFSALPFTSVNFGSITVPWANIWMLAAWPVVVAVGAYLKWAPSGRMIRAISDSWRTAEAMGVQNRYYYKIVFGIGSALAAPFALLFVWQNGLTPTSGLPPLLIASAAVILGGRESLVGGCIWALVLSLAGSLSTEIISPAWQLAVIFGLTFIVLFVKSMMSEGGLLTGEAAF